MCQPFESVLVHATYKSVILIFQEYLQKIRELSDRVARLQLEKETAMSNMEDRLNVSLSTCLRILLLCYSVFGVNVSILGVLGVEAAAEGKTNPH